VDAVLLQSDMALYAAKAGGRGRHVSFSPALGELSRRRAAIEAGLRLAIERHELALHWQPKLDIATGLFIGAEGLMRWTSPELGPVGPGEFIAVAESTGVINELGLWALREACRAAGTAELAGLSVAVNVSPLQLRDESLVAQVQQALQEFGLAPERLELEITESVFIADPEAALRKLHALRGLGIRIALDDFGTGYSSLSYLRRFPFDTLKIDRAFISEMLVQKDAQAIVEMIAALADKLGMRTVCEGVETAEQLRAVTAAGCHEVQGYLVSAPRPLAAFGHLPRSWRVDGVPTEALA
jgi:EAL domain-containing protein (putative c-di-GMP-specific phosphodiesterase class I)